MGRKKKEDLKAAVYKPFNPDELPKPPYYDITPEIIETTTLGDSFRRQIYTRPPYTITTTSGSDGLSSPYIIPPEYISTTTGPISEWSHTSTDLGAEAYVEARKRFIKEVIGDVEIINKRSAVNGEHVVACKNRNDLAIDKILKTLSAVKGKLMLDVAPIHIQKIECSITPDVRKNIVAASKRLKMYGKKCPIIARFDDYGNRLPDELELPDSYHGISLKIIDPKDYGDFYLEMKATEFPSVDYSAYAAPWEAYGEDVPF